VQFIGQINIKHM